MDSIRILLLLIAAACFILGLKLLGKPETARKGNMISAMGMLAAVLGTSLIVWEHHGSFWPMSIAILAGAAIGIPTAKRVKMTAMPEMVALFNGFGGIASLLVGWSQLHLFMVQEKAASLLFFAGISIFLAMLIGGITFTGSLVAFGKLAGHIPTKPIILPHQNLINGAVLLLVLVGAVVFGFYPDQYWIFLIAAVISLGMGITAVIPIGGADMPVVISLLNSYSGLAACAAGLAIQNTLLIITGALVGASGIILTNIMCKAMNRSLANVLFSGFGASSPNAAGGGSGEKREAKSKTPEDVYYLLEAANSVVFIPGYGMAVAQAQHAVRELADILMENGTDVKFAIHPVAGRMPGHMNVLLAEANVDYDQLVTMDDINPIMDTMDVAVVIGANDVVNPSARDDPNSSIYGMPIIEADRARTVLILKRSLGSGFAGIENPLFYADNGYMVFGDAKKTLEAIVSEFKED